MKATKMNTKNYIGALAGAIVLAGSAFAQAPDITKIKADAEAGNADAQARLAIAYFNGKGVAKDEREALKWVQKSADGGSALGQLNLGNMYLNGGCGLKQDPSEAFKWFTKSAAQSHRGGQCMMGESYLFGQGVKKNEQEAAKWFALAANAGSPRAQGYYAYMLANGLGIERNLEEALMWCKKGAEADDPGAKQTLPHIERAIAAVAQTPKSILGIEFGAKIEDVTGVKCPSKTQDGASVDAYVKPKKPFRKFTGANYNGRIHVYASVTSHSVFSFKWESEEFPKDTKEADAVEEVKKTCDVMARKFGSNFEEIPIKESDKWTIWDRKYMALWGSVKIVMELSCRKMTMTVTNLTLENQAKKEVQAIKSAEGDGSDAL